MKKLVKEDKFWHLRTIDEVLAEVGSHRKGLSENDVRQRIIDFGENKLSLEKNFLWYKVLLDKFNSLLIYILFAAGLVALFSGEELEFIIIMIIIVMTIFLGYFQEYKADRTINALNKLTAKKVIVIRDGKKKSVFAENLVPGDIVLLSRGDIVPADLRIIEVQGLKINEAIITGESQDRNKSVEALANEKLSIGDMINLAFSSTHVTGGSGVGVVVETGLNTFIGKVSTTIEKIKLQKSPIQKKIDLMSKRISYIVLSVTLLLLIIMLFKGNDFYTSILLVAAVAIAGIPESFPLALTLTFSNGIKKMAKQNAIVKDLNSVETLGTTTVICTDKTGTLTQNKMRVSSFLVGGTHIYETKGKGYEPLNIFYKDSQEIKREEISFNQEFLNSCVLCNDAEISFEKKDWNLIGEPTEGAIITFAKSCGMDENVIREQNKRVFIEPFDPLKKFMITVNKNVDDDKHYSFFLKGAGEIVLGKCSFYRDHNGNVHEISSAIKKHFENKIEEFNSKGLRVLSIASKKIECKSDDEKKFIESHLNKDYIFEGLVGIEDPIRDEVYDAVSQCLKAGIKIVMITGDHKLIAMNIGEKLGILNKNSSKVLEGFEIDKLNDKELDEVISDVAIFARTTPEHKLRIVDSFQRKGEIVAMTGDGVNDAPALKKADIGVSMGKNGTEVAREASNMVLTDDNFATIVKAVREGRTVYSNIRRFIYYLLTGNFTEVTLILVSVIILGPQFLPLTALMILFINLVTSTIPALALSIEPTHDKVMNQRPRNPKERLLSSYILTKIIILIPFLLFGTLGLFMWEYFIALGSYQKSMTFAFATLITFELFHTFNARRLHTTIFDKGFFSNVYIFLAVGVSFVLMFLTIYTPFGQEIFETEALELFDWIVIFVISSLVIVFSEIVKLSVRSEFNEQKNLRGLKFTFE